MTILYRTALVMGILMLVIFGLNISNQGINNLTMQNRKPVIGVQTKGDSISVFTLGESHSCTKQAIASEIMQVQNRVQTYGRAAGNYIGQIAEMIKVFLLS